jgi:tetratricopeptide (TPR) repeat protein
MNLLHCIKPIGLLVFFSFFLGFSNTAQDKEYNKLKDMIDKEKLDKAQAYCDQVTISMDQKRSGRFYALLGLGYINQKEYAKAANALLKSEDRRLSAKVAKELENPKSEAFDLKTAGKLYRIAHEFEKAAELLYKEGEYEEAAEINTSYTANLNYGKELFLQGKHHEALFFFKRAKKKGEKFSDQVVLDYYYKKKAYSTVYSIQNFAEGSFYLPVQGTVIDKMIEMNEPMPMVKSFLDSIGVKGSKQNEAILNSMANNQLWDKAEAYVTGLLGADQQSALAFLAEISKGKNDGLSAWANLKSGKTMIGKQQLTSYLLQSAIDYNKKWDKEPIEKKHIEDFIKDTKPIIIKCGQNYCEFAGFASSMANTRATETSNDSEKSSHFLKARTFLLMIEKNCK